jgi:hypothetical protein
MKSMAISVSVPLPSPLGDTDPFLKNEISRDLKQRRFSIDVVTENDGGRWASKSVEELKSHGDKEPPLPTIKHDDTGRRGFPYNDYSPHDADSQSDGDVGNLFLEMQNTSIPVHRPAFHTITQNGSDGWFQDEIIDVGVDFIEKIMQYEKYDIALSNVYYATDLFTTGHWAKAHADAAEADLATYIEAGSHNIDSKMKGKCGNKDFIIFPINDGFPNGLMTDQKEKRLWHADLLRFCKETKIKTDSGGCHWSVMVVDCRGDVLVGHYLDSMHTEFDMNSLNCLVATYLLVGLRLMLNEDNGHKYNGIETRFDPNVPHQSRNNAYGYADGDSACGPFVWLMAKEFTQYIVECKEDGIPLADINLNLSKGFAKKLEWDSRHTRRTLNNLINRELRVRK